MTPRRSWFIDNVNSPKIYVRYYRFSFSNTPDSFNDASIGIGDKTARFRRSLVAVKKDYQGDELWITGTLMFEKASSAKAVFDLLYQQINKPPTSIGAIDLPDNFATESATK